MGVELASMGITEPASDDDEVIQFSEPKRGTYKKLIVRDGRLVGPGDPAAQVRQVFENLTAALAAAGATMQNVVKLTIYLTDIADLDVFRQVREEYISAERPPASSLVQVSRLVHPEWRIEIEALAAT